MGLLQYKCGHNFLLWVPASSVFFRRNINHPGRWNTFILQLTVILTLIHQKTVDKSARLWQLLIKFQHFYHTAGWHVCLSDKVGLLPWKLVNRVLFHTHDHEWWHKRSKFWFTGNSALFMTADFVLFHYYPGTVCKDSKKIFLMKCFWAEREDRASTPSRGERQLLNLVRGGTVLFFSCQNI